MIIWLIGPSGAGKTTTGQQLAKLRTIPFDDVDALVEREAGASIEHIFSSEGESAFRSYEWNAILSLADAGGPRVVALGGGATSDPAVRSLIRSTGVRVFLDVDATTAIERLAADPTPRPLLFEEDPEVAWKRLYNTRRRHYADADIVLDARRDVDQVASAIDAELTDLDRARWSAEEAIGGQLTRIECYRSLLRTLRRVREVVGERRALVVIDSFVATDLEDLIHDPRSPIGVVHAVDGGEAGKTFAGAERLVKAMAASALTRTDVVVAIGGGSVLDLAGFAGSVYMRGIETLYVPTTLLAQVDAAVGGKTAVNAAGVRNLAGSVHQPRHVLICPAFLHTITARERSSGFVEAVKMGIVNSAELAAATSAAAPAVLAGEIPPNIDDVVRLSVLAKLSVVAQDARDHSVRLSLNFGHTVGHALEAVEPGRHAHGEAVAFGILAATAMAAEVTGLSAVRQEQIQRCVQPFALPVGSDHDVAAIVAATATDKKRSGGALRFVLPDETTGSRVYETQDTALVARSVESALHQLSSESAA